jgi:chromosome segregation ATPase
MEKFAAETRELEGLEKERETVMKELDDAEQRDALNKYELAELEHTHGELVNEKEDLKSQNEATVLPKLKELDSELEATMGEYKRQGEALERENKAKETLLERTDALEAEVAAAH